MKPTVSLLLFGWPVVALLLFLVMRPRRAVIATVVLAVMFLPIAGFKTSGLPAYTKLMATSLSALLGVALFDIRRLLAFRPGWADLPMALWLAWGMMRDVWTLYTHMEPTYLPGRESRVPAYLIANPNRINMALVGATE